MNYRKEIDGLRALSILPVIFFHFGFARFSGGYIGVDIFFLNKLYCRTPKRTPKVRVYVYKDETKILSRK